MKCLVDNQLPPALVRFLASKGVESLHVTDLGLGEATDAEIWKFATENQYILISKDEDFIQLAPKSPATRLIWVRLGNCRTAALLSAFEKLWTQIEQLFSGGEQIVEIR